MLFIQCDKCSELYDYKKPVTAARFRRLGWRISTQHICPECRNKKQDNEKSKGKLTQLPTEPNF